MTHASHPDQAPAAEGKVLRIVAGLHAGASRALAEREMILVGSGDDCDIVLADRGVAIRHALISVIDGAVQLRALDAPLKLEGRLLHPGDPEELPSVQRVGGWARRPRWRSATSTTRRGWHWRRKVSSSNRRRRARARRSPAACR
ncbi:FHA domain-containing protein [Luteimonas yindakuii]|uniref:FHA domain-containing protein n=1 Tax=Luteimonas yindakuii TaxID=2565782 RepID=UPI001107616E|nr:FHA domain-containing protein [Luteimonas yindakuii]QCU72765.1 FHA domain-containing protein [Luteimonas yindakuii]